jgi:urea carboxylase
MFGITPMPIFDPKQEISYLSDFMVFFNPGDIVKWKPIDRDAYDQAVADVEADRFTPLIRNVTFSLDEFQADIDGYNQNLVEALHGN